MGRLYAFGGVDVCHVLGDLEQHHLQVDAGLGHIAEHEPLIVPLVCVGVYLRRGGRFVVIHVRGRIVGIFEGDGAMVP